MMARGFTLLEILLALTLLALLAAGAFGGIRTLTRASQAGEEQIDRSNSVRVAQEFLRREISQTLALSYRQKLGTGERIMFEGERDQVTLVAPMPGYLGHGGPYVQELRFERVDGETKLVVRHALFNGYKHDRRAIHNSRADVLFEHFESGSFQYRGLNEKGELDDWQDDWDKAGRIPVLVRVKINPGHDSRVQWPELVVPLLVDASAATSSFGPDFGPGEAPPPVPTPKR